MEQKEQKKPEQKAEQPKEAKAVDRSQQIIRLVETNVDGRKTVAAGIREISGVSFMFGNAVAKVSGLEDRRLGDLDEHQLRMLEDIIANPAKYSIPVWLYNRRFDPVTGKDGHVSASTLDLTTKMDINEMKKIKTYKGIRHSLGLPVRGQRTKSSFRTGGIVGVKKKAKQATAPAGTPEKK
ncbi:MAG: 30S ribosomal protein S13 [Candidatus Aenigmarchaeota archaeon]|nr:30S ribosomal protein S13 [Candidatus Aenigmarchaeota archaeon]